MRSFLTACFLLALAPWLRGQTAGMPLVADPASAHAWVVVDKLETVTLPAPKGVPYMTAEAKATLVRPRALQTMPELLKLNPELGGVLPALPKLLETAQVATQFRQLMDAKLRSIASGGVLTAENYFDCATVLNLSDAGTGRKAVLFQSDMDVDTDGTDPVRKPNLRDYDQERISKTFLPRLSYNWPNESKAVNPFLSYPDSLLKGLGKVRASVQAEQARDPRGKVWTKLVEVCDAQEESVRKLANDADLRKDLTDYRFPLAAADPFVVIPGSWVYPAGDAYELKMGCLGVVIVGRVAYPCMVADSGPAEKCGEASLMLCQAIDPKATGKSGVVSGPKATYLLFPGTTWSGKPDVAKMRIEILRLLGEMGGPGAGAKLHDWPPPGQI